MKQGLKLTLDARAVLLAAQLTDAENGRGFVREHGDLRYSQLQKGSKRLREMRLLEESPSVLLTTEGERLARELQENDKRLHDGIPFSEREAAIKFRGGQDSANVTDEWFTTEIEGRQAVTNGNLIIFGKPLSDSKLEKSYIKHESVKRVWDEMIEGEPLRVRPVAYSEFQGYRERHRTVWFSDGSAMDAEIYRFVADRYAPLSWTHRQERDHRGFKYALNAYHRGVRVACAMPYKGELTETIEKMIEAANAQVVKKVEPETRPASQTPTVRPISTATAQQLSLLDSLPNAA